jgi:hypothetical protein
VPGQAGLVFPPGDDLPRKLLDASNCGSDATFHAQDLLDVKTHCVDELYNQEMNPKVRVIHYY